MKKVIKVYSEKGIIPNYATDGASGFDLRVQFTKDTCTSINVDDIKKLEKLFDDDLSDHTLHLLENTVDKMYPDKLTKTIIAYTLNPPSVFLSLKKAYEDKLNEINKKDNSNYIKFTDYLIDNNIEDINIIAPFSHNILPTGLFMDLETGEEIKIRPRSGIGAKTNMIAHYGTIDSDYRGNIGVIINNPSPFSYFILPNERLAQGVYSKIEQCEFELVDTYEELSLTDRGKNGYGSTGK